MFETIVGFLGCGSLGVLFALTAFDNRVCHGSGNQADGADGIVCDEPVSALDVSIQAQILNLLQDLQEKMELTFMFITHDLSVVNHFSDDIAVMYLGQLVEKAPAEELFAHPLHPYTKALFSAIPIPDPDDQSERIIIKGEITSPINLPDACHFAPRCQYCEENCHHGNPALVEVRPNHFVACSCVEEINAL